jgi:hypothetical protein
MLFFGEIKICFQARKKVRGLERHADIYPFLSISWISLFLIRPWINENKTGKDHVCKGKLLFLGDTVYIQFIAQTLDLK